MTVRRRFRTRSLALGALLALVAACGPPAYQKAGVSPIDQARDEAECREKAKEPRESRDFVVGPGGVMSYPYSDLDVAAYAECMQQRGYTRGQ